MKVLSWRQINLKDASKQAAAQKFAPQLLSVDVQLTLVTPEVPVLQAPKTQGFGQ